MTGVRPFLGRFEQLHQHNDLARYLSHIRHRNERIAGTTYIDYAYDREHCVAFCVDVEHATKLAEAFNAQNITSAVIHGALPKDKRKQLLKDFHDGKIRVLTNCQVLTEGWDEPKVNCIIHAAPTKSQSPLYAENWTEELASLQRLEKSIASSLTSLTSPRGTSLVTVADLVGLPPKFDFKGEDLLEVAVKFEEAKKANQHLLMDECQSLDEVKAKVEDVDLFIPEMPPVVRGARAARMVAGVARSLHDELPRRELPRARRSQAGHAGSVVGRDGQWLQVGQEDRAAAGFAPGSVRRRREVDVGQPWPRLRTEEPEGRMAQGDPDATPRCGRFAVRGSTWTGRR